MKKYITATIGSAVILPGFGQVLNGQIKKGLILMGIMFVILVEVIIKVTQIIIGQPGLNPDELNIEEIRAKINVIKIDVMDNSTMRIIVIVFLIVWIYSIIDAFITGMKIEKERN